MSHTPKYKAWDRSTKQIVDVGEIHFCHGGIMVFGTGVNIGNGWASRDDNLACDVVLLPCCFKEDRTGRELYDQDIVRVTIETPLGEQTEIGLIEHEGPEIEIQLSSLSVLFSYFESEDLEYLGNRFENPELLE